jgi:hypothetical protein
MLGFELVFFQIILPILAHVTLALLICLSTAGKSLSLSVIMRLVELF